MFLQKVRCLHVSAVRLWAAFAPFTLAGVHNSRPTKKRAHVHVDRRLRCARAHVTSCSALEERTRLPTHARGGAPLTTHSPPFAQDTCGARADVGVGRDMQSWERAP